MSLRGGDVPGFLPDNLRWHHLVSSPITHLVWKGADYIVANSEGLKKIAENTASVLDKEVGMIPNGVNREIFYPRQEEDVKNDSKTKLLFVGRLSEEKNVTSILDALGKIIKAKKELKGMLSFDIVGDGPLRAALEEKVSKLDLGGVVSFYGWVSREKIPEMYRDHDVFILSSSGEGMPNALLEAMASGLPIIATAVSGIEDLVSNGINGFLYTEPRELPALIEKLVSDQKLREKFGKASLEKAKSFSWETVAERYIDVCQTLK